MFFYNSFSITKSYTEYFCFPLNPLNPLNPLAFAPFTLYPIAMAKDRKDMTREEKVRHNRKRTLRRAYHKLSTEQRLKVNTRVRTRKAIKHGLIEKGPCEVCGCRMQIEAHHNNYYEWRDITWLCREHHLKYHQDIEKIKEGFKRDGLKIPYNFMPD